MEIKIKLEMTPDEAQIVVNSLSMLRVQTTLMQQAQDQMNPPEPAPKAKQ